MNYQELREALKEIIATVQEVPAKYQERCFEILLNNLIAGLGPVRTAAASVPPAPPAQQMGQTIPIKPQLRVFMRKTDITEDDLKKILFYENEDVHFIKEPKTNNSALGQMQWALFLALKNAILKDSFSVDVESVRSACQDKGFYNLANFTSYFKTKKYAKLFKEPMEPQGDPVQISDAGYTELAKLIRELAAD